MLSSRKSGSDDVKRRQRECLECGRRWHTIEVMEADVRRWRALQRKMSASKVSIQKLFEELLRVID